MVFLLDCDLELVSTSRRPSRLLREVLRKVGLVPGGDPQQGPSAGTLRKERGRRTEKEERNGSMGTIKDKETVPDRDSYFFEECREPRTCSGD